MAARFQSRRICPNRSAANSSHARPSHINILRRRCSDEISGITLRTKAIISLHCARCMHVVKHGTYVCRQQSQVCLNKAFRHTAVMIQVRRPLRHARQYRGASLARDQPTATRDQLDECHLEGSVKDGVDDWVECTRHVAEPKAHLEDDVVNATRVAHAHREVQREEWRPTEDKDPEHHSEYLKTRRDKQGQCCIRC